MRVSLLSAGLVLFAGVAAGCDSAAPEAADVAALELRIVDGGVVQTIDLASGDASDAAGGISLQGQTPTLSVSAAVTETGGRDAAVTLFIPLPDGAALQPRRPYTADHPTGRIVYAEQDGAVRTELQVEVTEASVTLREVTAQRLDGAFVARGTDSRGRTVEARGSFAGRRFDAPR